MRLLLLLVATVTIVAGQGWRNNVQFTPLDPQITPPTDFWMPLENPVPQDYCTHPRYPVVPTFGPIATDVLYNVFPNGTVPKAPAKPTNVWQKNLWGFEFDNFEEWGAVYPYPYIASPKSGHLLLMYPGAPVHEIDNANMQEGLTFPGSNNNTDGPPIYNASYPYLVMSAGFDLTLAVLNGDRPLLTTVSPMSATVEYTNSLANNATVATVYLVKGSLMVSVECNGAQLGFGFGASPPVIGVNGAPPGTTVTSDHLILQVATGPDHPQGEFWHAFFDVPVTVRVPIGAQQINLTSPYTGLLQLGVGEVNNAMAPLLQKAAGTYVKNVSVQYDINDETNQLNMHFLFTQGGNSTSPVIMLALAHHVTLLPSTAVTSKTLYWCVKGNMTAVIGSSWTLGYNLTSRGFGDTLPINPQYSAALKAAAVVDYNMKIGNCPGDNATYGYPGYKNMELYAYVRDLTQMTDIAITLENLGERGMAVNMTKKVLECMSWLLKRPSQAPHPCPNPINNTVQCVRDQMDIYFDTTWGGLITGWYNRFAAHYCQCDKPGGPDACKGYNYCDNPHGWSAFSNYGNAFYNDHHFQYGYVIKNLAWPIYFQSIKGVNLTLNATVIQNLTKQALAFARDIANPTPLEDKYFAYLRHKDTYDGHSWAEGYDYSGRILTWVNQQSGGEAINAYYAVYLLGLALNDTNVLDWGRVNLATEMVSVGQYQLLSNQTADKIDQPTKMINKWGKCLSMIEGNGANAATYFGPNSLFECGIIILPISPITDEWVPASWSTEAFNWMEWHVNRGGLCVFFDPLNMTVNPCPGQFGPNWTGNEWACCPTNQGFPRNQWRAFPDWFPHMYFIQSIANPSVAWENLDYKNLTLPTETLPFPYINTFGAVVGFADDMTRTGTLFNIATRRNQTK